MTALNNFRFLLFAATVLGLQACSPKLLTVLTEDPAGNVELTYNRSISPENIVREVRFYPNGDTLSVTPMKNAAVHGVVSNYFPGNKLKDQTTFENGTSNGRFCQFDQEGTLIFEGELKNGMKTGVWITWYDEVQMQEQRAYLNDQPDGKWTYWYIDGTVKREETYQLGKLIDAKDVN